MALSGNFQNYVTSKFGLYCEWRGEQDIIGNYTDITLDKYLSYSQLEVGKRADSAISINGETEIYTAPAINDYSSGYKKKKLKSKTVRVYHSADGKAENIPLSVSWRFSGTYAGVSINTVTAESAITLDRIDRAAPSVSLSAAAATPSSVTVHAVASAECDLWEYCTDGVEWMSFSTQMSTVKDCVISNLAGNTEYTVKIRARKVANGVYGVSSVNVKTLGGVTLNSTSDLEADSPSPEFSIAYTVYASEYSYRLDISKDQVSAYSCDLPAKAPGVYTETVSLTPEEGTALLNRMQSSKAESFTLTLTALTDTTVRGVSSKPIRVFTTEKNSAPIFGGFNCYDGNPAAVAVTGSDRCFIKNISSPNIELCAVIPRNGALHASTEVIWGDCRTTAKPTSGLVIPPFTECGDIDVTVTVIDTRGYRASSTGTLCVIDYEKPCIVSHSVKRVDSITDTVHCIVSGKLSELFVNGQEKNTVESVHYEYKTGSYNSSEWSVSRELNGYTVKDGMFTVDQVLPDLFDPQLKSYIKITVKDRFEQISNTYVIYQGFPEISIRRRKVGVDCSDPQRTLDVGGEIGMNGYNVMGLVKVLDINDDLNDITDSGYYSSDRGISAVERNYPVSVDGLLEVLIAPNGNGLQRFYPYNNTGYYTRTISNGEWFPWRGYLYM